MDFIDEMLEKDPRAKESFAREARVHDVHKKIIEKLVKIRKQKMTQAEMAAKMGVSQPRVACLETMKEPFNLRTLIEYADVLSAHVSVETSSRKSPSSEARTEAKIVYSASNNSSGQSVHLVKEQPATALRLRKSSGSSKKK